jgi:hypothetical protein
VAAAKLTAALQCDAPLAGAEHPPVLLVPGTTLNPTTDFSYALRFWPDTRAMVDDLIGLSPSNHGTLDAIPLCEVGCAASIWQQRSNAKFIAALNSRAETFAHRDRDLRRHRVCPGDRRDHPSRAGGPEPRVPDRLPGSADAGRRSGGLPGQLRQDERRGGHDAGHLSPHRRRASAGLLRHGDVPAVASAASPCPN